MKYILAVSGGIDSMVLLNLVARDADFRYANFSNAQFPDDFVVAHFDHGIRGVESNRDAQFVMEYCQQYGVVCEVGKGNLPANCSEVQARTARWRFFNQLQQQYDGDSIIVTAHHADDVIETAVMFMVRGTGWRGLTPLGDTNTIHHPLKNWTKQAIAHYALENNLDWVEDSTNDSMRYFRNRVRRAVATWPLDQKRSLLDLINSQYNLRSEIEQSIASLSRQLIRKTDDGVIIRRYHLIMLPDVVAIDLLWWVTNRQLTRPQLQTLLWFVRAARPNKRIYWKRVGVLVEKAEIFISVDPVS